MILGTQQKLVSLFYDFYLIYYGFTNSSHFKQIIKQAEKEKCITAALGPAGQGRPAQCETQAVAAQGQTRRCSTSRPSDTHGPCGTALAVQMARHQAGPSDARPTAQVRVRTAAQQPMAGLPRAGGGPIVAERPRRKATPPSWQFLQNDPTLFSIRP